ncbi:MAG: hypothetical protein ACPGUV_04360 [Polyangiales bacterium]
MTLYDLLPDAHHFFRELKHVLDRKPAEDRLLWSLALILAAIGQARSPKQATAPRPLSQRIWARICSAGQQLNFQHHA